MQQLQEQMYQLQRLQAEQAKRFAPATTSDLSRAGGHETSTTTTPQPPMGEEEATAKRAMEEVTKKIAALSPKIETAPIVDVKSQ